MSITRFSHSGGVNGCAHVCIRILICLACCGCGDESVRGPHRRAGSSGGLEVWQTERRCRDGARSDRSLFDQFGLFKYEVTNPNTGLLQAMGASYFQTGEEMMALHFALFQL